MLMLNNKGVSVYEVMNWQVFLKECVKKKLYMFALKKARDIMRGINHSLRGVPTKNESLDLLPPFFKLIFEAMIPSLKEEQVNQLKMLSQVMVYVLIRVGLFDYLLDDFGKLMASHGYEEHYLDTIKLFYDKQLIPILEEKIIIKIINLLETRDKRPITEAYLENDF